MGDPRSTGTGRGTSATRCSPRSSRAGGTASSASENVLTGLVGPAVRRDTSIAAPYVTATQEAVPRDGAGTGLVTKPIRGTRRARREVDAHRPPSRSTQRSTPTSRRSSPTWRRSRPTSASPSSIPRSARSSSRGSSSSPRRCRPSTRGRSRRPAGGLRGTGKLGAHRLHRPRGRGPRRRERDHAGPERLDFRRPGLLLDRSSIGRVRQDFGALVRLASSATDREVQGGGYNRVLGPDFRWQPERARRDRGPAPLRRSATPDRPDLAPEWDGGALSGHAADVWWNHSTATVDWFVEYRDLSDGFRADVGFVPQVGFREGTFEAGYTFHPTGFFTGSGPSCTPTTPPTAAATS